MWALSRGCYLQFQLLPECHKSTRLLSSAPDEWRHDQRVLSWQRMSTDLG